MFNVHRAAGIMCLSWVEFGEKAALFDSNNNKVFRWKFKRLVIEV